eukprot:9181049-Alexandrium_andersonii.AAC.1
MGRSPRIIPPRPGLSGAIHRPRQPRYPPPPRALVRLGVAAEQRGGAAEQGAEQGAEQHYGGAEQYYGTEPE